MEYGVNISGYIDIRKNSLLVTHDHRPVHYYKNMPKGHIILSSCFQRWDTLEIFLNDVVKFSLPIIHFEECGFGMFRFGQGVGDFIHILSQF